MAVRPANARSRGGPLSPLVEVTTHSNGTDALIVVNGDLDAASEPLLRESLEAVLAEHPRQVFVDLAGVPFIDSTAISLLLGAWRRAAAQGGHLVLCGPAAPVMRVLDLTGLSDIIAVRST